MIGDVTHFYVYINGIQSVNASNCVNKSLILAKHTICSHCSSYNVSVRAVNRCGRLGESTPNITLDALDSNYSQFCNNNNLATKSNNGKFNHC